MIVLITPTGARPFQTNMAVKWMRNQTYQGRVVWIIVDDCIPSTTDKIKQKDFPENWEIIKTYPTPSWEMMQNTQGRNIAWGIWEMQNRYQNDQIRAIFIIEDDDYYSRIYLDKMVPRIAGYQAAGETHTIYYNIATRRYNVNANIKHASLFQTAFTPAVLPLFERCLETKFIDMAFWSLLKNVNLFREGNLAVGIKGLPGRPGIGGGHYYYQSLPFDPEMKHLQELIGADYKYYLAWRSREQATAQ